MKFFVKILSQDQSRRHCIALKSKLLKAHIPFKVSHPAVFRWTRIERNSHSLSGVYEGASVDFVAIVHELWYIIGMNIEKLAVKLRVNLDASRRPRCLRAETCCGQLSSPFLSSPNPPYSPIAATLLQNCTNILDYPASWQCLRSQRRSRASASARGEETCFFKEK